MAKQVLTYDVSEPLGGVTFAKVDINSVDGNLTVDTLACCEQVLASGKLQYTENQKPPTQSLETKDGQTTLMLKSSGKGQTWLKMPWSACNSATEWRVHLNPAVAFEIVAHSGGGNVKLDLSGLTVTGVKADTGGGNMEVVLPDNAKNLSVFAKTGAGNAIVSVPGGIAVKVLASSGLGTVIMDPQFNQIDKNTYQSPDFDSAADKIEVTVSSGAGNVSVLTR
jgi:hypothetical protein